MQAAAWSPETAVTGPEMPPVLRGLSARIRRRTARVGVVGLGHVGLPLACRLAIEAGFEVTAVEADAGRLAALRAGRSYLSDLAGHRVARLSNPRRHRLEADPAAVAGCEVVVLCLPTPLGAAGRPDLAPLRSAMARILPVLQPGALLALESTVHPGATREELAAPLAAAGRRPGRNVFVAYSPERINPGDPSSDPFAVPKLVAGVTPACLAAAGVFYGEVFRQLVPVSSPEVAEMAKLLENCFRSVNIGLVNEMKTVATALGVDVWEVIRAASTKPFGFMSFSPGPGLGGHCLPVDPHYLAWAAERAGAAAPLVETAAAISAAMPGWVAGRIRTALERRGVPAAGARVLLLGAAYKPGVRDLRGAPALEIARQLHRCGTRVVFSDPRVDRIPAGLWPGEGDEPSQPLTAETLRACDAVVLVTDHDDFDYRLIRECSRLVVDTRGRLPAAPNVVRA